MFVRPAVSQDLPALLSIYAHHVRHGLGSFEEETPSLAEMKRRYEEVTGSGLPYLVAEENGEILGYGYCALYRARSAYRFTLEDSVYVKQDMQRKGIGKAMLGALIVRCADLNYRQLIAVIGDSANVASIAVHASLGFVRAGNLRSSGYKLDRWVDAVLMQRPLGEGDMTPPNSGEGAKS